VALVNGTVFDGSKNLAASKDPVTYGSSDPQAAGPLAHFLEPMAGFLRAYAASDRDIGAQIDAILFCTQSEDYVMPPDSCLLHGYLGLREDIFAIDFNLACSGFVYGLALAQSLLAGGIATNVSSKSWSATYRWSSGNAILAGSP